MAVGQKRGKHLRVPVFPEEEGAIAAKAEAAGLSIAAYLRQLGLGYEIRGVLDQQLVLDLAKINADQGRLGGLLKLWLNSDKRLAGYPPAQLAAAIVGALKRIEETQAALLALARKA